MVCVDVSREVWTDGRENERFVFRENGSKTKREIEGKIGREEERLTTG